MESEKSTAWESYEDVARYLLEEIGDALGLELERVEGKQTLVGESGATWEIEGKGIKGDRCHRVSAIHHFQAQAERHGSDGVDHQ